QRLFVDHPSPRGVLRQLRVDFDRCKLPRLGQRLCFKIPIFLSMTRTAVIARRLVRVSQLAGAGSDIAVPSVPNETWAKMCQSPCRRPKSTRDDRLRSGRSTTEPNLFTWKGSPSCAGSTLTPARHHPTCEARASTYR